MRRTTRSASQAAAALRMVAMTLGRGSTAPGAYYRRIAARKGKPRAVNAAARKLAVLVYRVPNGDIVYRRSRRLSGPAARTPLPSTP
jgi:transposase